MSKEKKMYAFGILKGGRFKWRNTIYVVVATDGPINEDVIIVRQEGSSLHERFNPYAYVEKVT